MAIIYFIVIIIIIKNHNNSGILTIHAPKRAITPVSEISFPAKDDLQPSSSKHYYLNAIAKLLLSSQEEPLKIAHFLDSLATKDDRSYLMVKLKDTNQKLYDTVESLSAIDTSDSEGFHSNEIKIDIPDQWGDNISIISPEEEILNGGIPADFFYEEMKKNGFTDFSEFINQITETYIVKSLSQLQIQEIEQIGSKILTTPKPTKTSLSLQNTFEEGEKIAIEIQKELENQTNN